MPHYEYFSIPGVDWLGRKMRHYLAWNQVTSAAEQLGKKQVLTESFAKCGHNISFDEMRFMIEQQYMRGINLVCQHLEGYSLAGLFALWAGLTCTDFGAVASCSGSLWYDGWADFMETHRAKAPLRVYLSLGSGEAKTRDPRMQSVGVNTHTAEWHCNQDPMVTRYTYKVHPGGHFKDIEKRMASALAWLSR